MPTRYEIVVQGAAGPVLLAALPGFEVRPARAGEVRLVGPVDDQSALQGALHRLHDLHVELLRVRQLPL